MYQLRYRGQYSEAVAAELEAMMETIKSWVATSHDENGENLEGTRLVSASIETPVLEGAVHQAGMNTWTDDGVIDITLNGTTHDLAADDGSPITQRVIRVDMSGPTTLTGILPPDPNAWWERWIVNRSGYTLTIAHNNASSTTYARFGNPGSGSAVILDGGMCLIGYDPESGNWRLAQG